METELLDLQYMKAALAEAEAGMHEGEIPVGAVVVCQGRIIARAHNLSERLNDPTAHAEMQAITAATNYLGGKYLDSCTLYVTLEPCVMCAGALAWSQVARVVYGAGDEKRGFLKLNKPVLHPKTELTGGILSEECGKLLIEFFKSRR
jgi:tRNA(adenine34) deaminase